MGIIRKQGIQTSILINAGFALGAFNILILFPHFLTKEQSGLVFLFVVLSKMILGFAALGTLPIMNKFFPYYNAYLPKKKNDFLFSSLLLPTVGFLIVIALMLSFKDLVFKKTVENSPLFTDYYYILIPFSFFLVIYSILETYSTTHFKAVFPAFLREIGIRVITTLLVVLFAFHILNFKAFMIGYSTMYVVLIIAIVIYLIKLDKFWFYPHFSKVTKRLKGKMFVYGGYIYGGVLIGALAENADVLIIGSLSGLGQIAVYQTGHFVATIIQIPYRSLSAISTPMIAQAWKDKNTGLISEIYKKTSLNQLIAGLLIFGLIWINIDLLLTVLGENFDGVKPVVFILGIARLVDLAFGHNSEILGNSKYWKFNFLSYVFLVLIFLPTNYLLVKEYGIAGSAISNLLSFFLFNIIRYFFIWKKMRMQPFNQQTFYILLIAFVAFLPADLLVNFGNVWIQSVVRSAVFVILFSVPLLYFSISEDVNGFVRQLYHKYYKSS